jgi:transcriptional regulator GlxA family with amidase domain
VPAGWPNRRSTRAQRRRRIAIVLFDGFDELDAIGPYEVLSSARAAGAGLDLTLVTLGAPREVQGSHGVRVAVDDRLSPETDVVIVPGGGWNARADRGAWGEVARRRLPEALAALQARGTLLSSVCTGAMLLGAGGLLRGRPATTHHAARDDLRRFGATPVDARVVDDGDVITAAGVTAGIDGALWLVEREWGAHIATTVAREMEYEPSRAVWHAATGGARRPPLQSNAL